MSEQFEFLVIGDDEASLAAAAAAAKAGAPTALLRPAERNRKRMEIATPPVPNFVWRRLDLQEYDLAMEPVSARVTLFDEGETLATYASPRETADALAQEEGGDHFLWSDFLEELTSLGAGAPMIGATPAHGGKALAAMLAAPQALDQTARLGGACADLLDDSFENPHIKAHLAAHALGPAGLGDLEAGSAAVVKEFLSEDAWRARTVKDAQSLARVLEKVCQDAGVQGLAGKVTEIGPLQGKYLPVTISDKDGIRVRRIIFATPDAALRASAGADRNARFTVRFRLSERPPPPAGDDKALFEIIDNGEDIQIARDAAVMGKLFERPPLQFEYAANGEIIAHTSYFPAAFYEDGEWRGWTGQDRQAAAAIVKERIASRIPGFSGLIRRTETEVNAPGMGPSPFAECEQVVVQPRCHDAIGAAVKLIDEMMARNE